MEISKEVFEVVNKPGRAGVLATTNKAGHPNVAYFGSPQLMEDGTLVMGLGDNRSLKNLEENPHAAFFSIGEIPVGFATPGYRLYLRASEIQKEGPLLDSVKKAIADAAGEDAANMMAAGVVFEVTEVRSLVDMP